MALAKWIAASGDENGNQSTCIFGHAQNQLWCSVYRNTKHISYDVVSLPFLSYVIREL